MLPQEFLYMNSKITFLVIKNSLVQLPLQGMLIHGVAISPSYSPEDHIYLYHKNGRAAKCVLYPQYHLLLDKKDSRFH